MNYKYLENKILLTLFLTFLIIFFGAPTYKAKAVTVSPIRIELATDPGTSKAGSFKVTNDETKQVTYQIIVAKFETKDETGEPAFVPGKDGIPSWIETASSVTIESHGSKVIPFNISVPENAEPGGYFAGIFVSKTAPNVSGEADIGLESNVGTLIFLRVNGAFIEGETILEFNTKDKKKFFTSLPVEFYYRFQNSGEDRVKPLGDIIIKNIFGITSKILNANRTAGSVLPKSIRKFFAVWQTSGGNTIEQSSSEVQNQPEGQSYFQTLKWQWQHFALGRYVAHTTVTVNNDASRSYSKSTSFWVVPWQLVGTIILGLTIIFGVLLGLAIIIVLLILRKRK